MKTVATLPKRSHWKALAEVATPRLQPPEHLTAAQKAAWHTTVDSLPPDWFSVEQTPLLTAYVGHIARAEQIEQALAGLDPLQDLEQFDRLTKLAAGESAKIAMHARGMRLTVQSRLKPDAAFTQATAAAGVAHIGATKSPYFDDLIAR